MPPSLNWVPIRGDCMWPTLQDGDRAQWLPTDVPVRVGAVVVARGPTGLIAHRVLAVLPEGVVLRGDNLRRADPPVPTRAVLGTIAQVERRGQLLEPQDWDAGPSWKGRIRWVARALARRGGALWT
jgi:phage repressor protein C with HTH and peptisase S24 domain